MSLKGILGIVMVSALLLTACGQAAPAAPPTQAPAAAVKTEAKPEAAAKVEYPTMHFKIGSALQKTHVSGLGLEQFAKNMSEMSGGKVTAEIFYDGSLITGRNELEGIGKGLVDFGVIVTSYHAKELPFFDEAALMPFLYNYESLPELFSKVKPQLEQELADQRLKLIAHYPTSLGMFLPKPIDAKNPDFTGLKLRSVGGGMTTMIRQFGGSTVEMPSPEVPVALRTGVMDGLGTSYLTWSAIGIMDDVPHAYYSDDFATFSLVAAVSKDRYAKLPPVVQELVDKSAIASERWIYDNIRKEQNEIMAKAAQNPKVKLHELSPDESKAWRTKMEPVYQDFAKRYGDKGANFIAAGKEALARVAK